ncbi:hypothetical protein N2152v2_010910 [Parachlorella kessleri]
MSPQPSCRRRAWAGKDNSEEGADGVNIDELAARLAAEAEKMRQSGETLDVEALKTFDEGAVLPLDASASPLELPVEESLLEPLGFQSTTGEDDMLREVGDGGFFASEFELEERLGQISIQQVERSSDMVEALPTASTRKSMAAVIAYVARYHSGLPFQEPVYVMLKEYLPGAKKVACNELQVLKYMTGMPRAGRKWERAKAPLAREPPVAQLLGYFEAGLSESAEEVLQPSIPDSPSQQGSPATRATPNVPAADIAALEAALEAAPDAAAAVTPPEAGVGPLESTVWVVMKWEGLTPVALYPSSPQQQRSGFGMLFGERDSPFRDRIHMLRCICRASLAALAYCHDRGVVHGSLGSGSILLSTFEDAEADQLIVKLDNFGFARRIVPAGVSPTSSMDGTEGSSVLVPQPNLGEETPLAMGQKQDLRALAIVLLECLLSSLAEGGPSPATSAEAIERVLGEVFQWDVNEFRQYCANEPDWGTAAAFLDDENKAGWLLIEALVHGRAPASLLKESLFCQL